MNPEQLRQILNTGESIEVEFKTSRTDLNKDAFESVCAFLNRNGGHLLLGVKNDGTVEGVQEDRIQTIIDHIITSANNPNKLSPPFYLSAKVIQYQKKQIIHVYVPESSQVHSTAGRIFDRNEDGDLDVTKHTDQVTQLYLRKQNTYSENRVFPYTRLSDFKSGLFKRVRITAQNLSSGYKEHPWVSMTDEELLRSAGLFKHDHQTGKDGYTLAAILLFGKDETIMDVLPHHKTDAILRIENLDRYDDRDDIRTNLIESYDRLMAFIQKHLPDKFYQENEHRSSLRDRLFREVVSNMLIHREFSNAFPAKLIIEKNRVYAENWNRPHGSGAIDPANFSPYPKNPVIARFFKEIGRVDELGSGIRNVNKYTGIYTPGAKPEFLEGDIFKTIIPLISKKSTTQIATQITTRITTLKMPERIIELLKENPSMSRKELAEVLGDITEDGVKYHLDKLKEDGKIERVGGTRGYWKVR
ncbi:MAG: putative DNA binding domain-containing protein [Flavobacteriales bacterium]|nr:putative DNA binding domain-containing protein [Flavobacteriales bacterium]